MSITYSGTVREVTSDIEDAIADLSVTLGRSRGGPELVEAHAKGREDTIGGPRIRNARSPPPSPQFSQIISACAISGHGETV
jgi:hypothetical protein